MTENTILAILAAGCVLVTAPIWIIEHKRKVREDASDNFSDSDERLASVFNKGRK